MQCQPFAGNKVGEVSNAEKSRKMVKIRKGHNVKKKPNVENGTV